MPGPSGQPREGESGEHKTCACEYVSMKPCEYMTKVPKTVSTKLCLPKHALRECQVVRTSPAMLAAQTSICALCSGSYGCWQASLSAPSAASAATLAAAASW